MSDISGETVVGRKPLTIKQLQFVNWVEQQWNSHRRFPTFQAIRKRWGDEIIDSMSEEIVIAALSNRGIKIPQTGDYPEELTDEQVAAVGLVLDYADKRSHNTKLRSLGITPAKWNGWLKNEVFKNYLHSLSSRGLDDALHVAHTGLIHATERGDTNAIKYYMELTGRFSGDSGESQNFKVMLQRMVETIQRHVKDPDTIRLIANDFKVIVEGGIPNTVPVLDRSDI